MPPRYYDLVENRRKGCSVQKKDWLIGWFVTASIANPVPRTFEAVTKK
ncbi:MAG: hypothetical protein PHT07_17685 [Paludibacter sp.]|nr:hypothetical protein [Paludibacter sp.]